MLSENDLLNHFWGEAVNIACYIINRAYVRFIVEKTSYKLWKNRKPNIFYSHAFGSKCFVHNNKKETLEKFDAKSDEGIFCGYSSLIKAYSVTT